MGIGLRALVLATSFMASPAFAADQQFDLICTSPTGEAHYRVDLDKNEVCEDDCSSIRKIASVTSGELKLTDLRPSFAGERSGVEESAIVNRTTGAWSYYARAAGKTFTHDGTCKAAPFSGFPAVKF